jgi:putative peptidoglycan lipid II flippase
MIRKLLTSKISSIASAAVVIALAGLASRFLGLIRDRVLASEFGAGAELDMYNAAFRAPDLIYNLVIFGALAAGFIPIFTGLLKKEDDEKYSANKQAWDLVNNVINVFAMILIAVCVILFIFADKLVPLIAPGFSASQMATTVSLTRLMFLSPIFLGLSGIIGGVLQTYKRFLAFSLAPIMYNLGIITGALLLVPYLGIYGLVVGVVAGAFLHFIVQVPVAVKLGWRYKFIFNLKDKNLREIFRLMIPRVIGLAATQLNLFVVTIFGSLLAAGSISIYNFANNLQSFPLGLIGLSFALAAFPTLSSAYAKKDYQEFNQRLASTFKLITFAIVPLTALFIILRIQIVRVVLGAGAFDWQATQLTADALGLFAVSLFAQCLIALLSRAFFARHNTFIPLVAGLAAAIVNIFLCYILVEPFGVLGLALAFSISAILDFAVLMIVLRWHIGNWGEARIVLAFLKVTGASIVLAAVAQSLKDPIASVVDMNKFWGIFTQGAVCGLAGLLAFCVMCKLLKCQEFDIIIASVKRRLFKKVEVKSESIRTVE